MSVSCLIPNIEYDDLLFSQEGGHLTSVNFIQFIVSLKPFIIGPVTVFQWIKSCNKKCYEHMY